MRFEPSAAAAALLLLLSGCDYGGGASSGVSCFGFCGIGVSGPSRYTESPAILPNDMRIGDTVRLEVHFVDPTGSVVWTSDDPAVARWDRPSPECPGDSCRILRAVAPGTTYVSRKLFCSDKPGDGCGTTTTRVRVSPWVPVAP